MPSLIRTGKIPKKDLEKIIREINNISSNAGPARVTGNTTHEYKPSRRESLVYFAKSNEIKFTYNYLVSVIIENYSNLQVPLNDVSIQYACYDVGGHFVEHSDIIYDSGKSIRGFTFSINITPEDSYTGGDLILTQDDTKLDREQGSFIIFPAYKRHRVDIVTSGRREAIVVWVHMSPKDVEWLEKHEKLP